MSEYLTSFLQTFSAQDITEFFVNAIVFTGITCLLMYLLGLFKGLTSYASNLLTSIGILGTFTGIIIGLMNFDASSANAIDASISNLLEGLKSAFITSMAGMAAAIIFKIITSLVPSPSLSGISKKEESKEIKKDATGNDLLAEIKNGNAHQVALQQELKDINKALSGEGDSSLSTLITKQRLERREFNEALCKRLDKLQDSNQETTKQIVAQSTQLASGIESFKLATGQNLELLGEIKQGMGRQEERFEHFAQDLELQLQSFAEMLSKSATEQMIEALKNVISEFNERLTEQFGENFKALDASVKRLVDWQAQYKEQLGEMRAQFDLSVKALTDSEKSVNQIRESAATIPETMSGMQVLLETARHQIDELERHLQAFVEMRDKAAAAVPEMQQQVEASVTDVTRAANAASEHYQTLLTNSDSYIRQHNESVNAFLQRFTETTDESSEKLGKQLLDSSEAIKKTLSEGSNTIGLELQRQSQELGSQFNLSSQALEKGAQLLSDTSGRVKERLENSLEVAETQVRDFVNNFSKETQAMLEELKKGGVDTAKQIEVIQSKAQEGAEEMRNKLTNSFEEVINAQTEQMNKAYNNMAGLIQDATKKGSESIQEQTEKLDNSMQEEINRVMQTMGTALAQIAGRFTEDYQKLTAQMQQIVESASNVGT